MKLLSHGSHSFPGENALASVYKSEGWFTEYQSILWLFLFQKIYSIIKTWNLMHCVYTSFYVFLPAPDILKALRTWRKENGWNGRSGKALESIGHREWNVDLFPSPCFRSHTNYIIRNLTHLTVFLLNERVAFWRQQRRKYLCTTRRHLRRIQGAPS